MAPATSRASASSTSAPFATLAESLAAARAPATLFYGARTAGELFYLDFFEKLGVKLVLSTEDGGRGVKGRVTAPLEAALKSLGAEASAKAAVGAASVVV